MGTSADWLDSYLGRLAGYGVVAIIASWIGSYAVGPESVWQQPTPFSAATSAGFSLGPALLILASFRLPLPMMIGLSLLSAVGMIEMWQFFATNESSTSSFVFLWGWIVGIPVALVPTITMATISSRAAGGRPMPHR